MGRPRTLNITDKVFSHEHNEARKKAYEQSMPTLKSFDKFVEESKLVNPAENLGESLDFIFEALKQRDELKGTKTNIKITDIIFILEKYKEFNGDNLLG